MFKLDPDHWMLKPTTLDITEGKEFKIKEPTELFRAIESAVASTQTLIIRPLPNILKITVDQFKTLQPFLTDHGNNAYMMQTRHNMMDVQIHG